MCLYDGDLLFEVNKSILVIEPDLKNNTWCECRAQIFFPLHAFNTENRIMRQDRNRSFYSNNCSSKTIMYVPAFLRIVQKSIQFSHHDR